jgi:hypothetical protein
MPDGDPMTGGIPGDEGELHVAIMADHQHKIVRIRFGKSVTWLGLESPEARQFAQMLTSKADELDSGTAAAPDT